MEERLVTCANGLHGNRVMTDALNCMFGASLHLVRLFLNPCTVAFSVITRTEEFLLYYNISASCLSTMALSFLKYRKLTHPLNKQPCKVIYLTMFQRRGPVVRRWTRIREVARSRPARSLHCG